jgi:hypothetical protein
MNPSMLDGGAPAPPTAGACSRHQIGFLTCTALVVGRVQPAPAAVVPLHPCTRGRSGNMRAHAMDKA